MTKYRSGWRVLVACTACATGLSLAACSAGITAASSAAPSTVPSAASSRPAASPSPSPSPAARPSSSISVSGLGGFPVPAGARTAENASYGGQTVIVLTSVTPAEMASFYASALPQAGFAITDNASVSGSNGTTADIEFTGNGYKGSMVSGGDVPTSGIGLAGLRRGHFAIITLSRS